MPKNIDEIEFTIFDTETTGLDPDAGDRIVEIAALRIRGEELLSAFEALVNPERPISPGAFAVNKITEDMLRDAPKISQILPGFLDFIKGSYLCSYNAIFDLGFINNELKLIGRDFPQETVVIDILTMARRLLPTLERYALWFVAQKLGLETKQEHRALSDVKITLEVFRRLTNTLKEKGIADLNNFLSLFSLNSDLARDINSQKLAKIQEAIDLGAGLKIKYLSGSTATVSERQVLPKEIKTEANKIYMVGHCCLRNDERTFSINGILHLEIL